MHGSSSQSSAKRSEPEKVDYSVENFDLYPSASNTGIWPKFKTSSAIFQTDIRQTARKNKCTVATVWRCVQCSGHAAQAAE